MQRLGSLLLIMSGISLGAYTFLPPPRDTELSLRDMTRISAAPDRSEEIAGVSADGDTITGSTLPRQGLTPARVPRDAAAAKPVTNWTAVVTAAPSQHGRITSSKPGDEATRLQLTRDLQSELKRVGCYGGEITGAWTPSTRRAMSAFMDRVNASLPMEEPDYILLTLVQGHKSVACGETCPSGQSSGVNGRCLPNSVLAARATKPATRVVAARQETPPVSDTRGQTGSVRQVQPEKPTWRAQLQRVAAADRGDAAADSPVESGAQAGRERLPWQTDELSDRRGDAAAPVAKRARPAGMMAVGAPKVMPAAEPDAVAPRATSTRRNIALYAEEIEPQVSAAPVLRPDTISPQDVRPKKATRKAKRKSNRALARKAPSPANGRPGKKPKLYYYAGNGGRRGMPRPGSPAYNMLQAMGGIF